MSVLVVGMKFNRSFVLVLVASMMRATFELVLKLIAEIHELRIGIAECFGVTCYGCVGTSRRFD